MTTETSVNDLVTAYKTNYETELNTDVPSQRRAFLGVMSVQEAVCHKAIDKRVAAAQKAVFAVRAGAEGLAVIGQEFGVPRGDAVKYVAACKVAAAGGSSVTAGDQLTSEATGAYYTVNANASEGSGFILFSVTAEDSGEDPNLEAAVNALDFTSRPAGVTAKTQILSVTTYGANEEDLEVWRAKVLIAERAAYGGGNTADYRYWAEQVALVKAAYPYSGRPIVWKYTSSIVSFVSASGFIIITETPGVDVLAELGDLGVGDMIQITGSDFNDGFKTVNMYVHFPTYLIITVVETLVDEPTGNTVEIINQSLPGDRTVFVESELTNPIPTSGLLTSVRAAINYGTDGTYQPAIGDIESTLYVEPVRVAEIYIEVLNLDVAAAVKDQCQARVVDDLVAYCATCRPYISGLDFEMDRKDILTDLTIGKVVQGVLEVYGAASDGVRVAIGSAGAETVSSYQLNQGEIAVLSMVWDDADGDWGP
jgi:hypothetical protein